MIPERDRLADNIGIAAPLRSATGIRVLKNLVSLLTNGSLVAYQEALRPKHGRCPVETCLTEIDR